MISPLVYRGDLTTQKLPLKIAAKIASVNGALADVFHKYREIAPLSLAREIAPLSLARSF